jgi:hypothetical protein
MNEYFISYYGCEFCMTEPECPKACEKKLCWRDYIGNLTEEEIKYFMKKVEEMGGFADNPSVASRYVLHSLNDLSLDTLEAREEQIKARLLFENDYVNIFSTNFNREVRRFMRKFNGIAETIRNMRPKELPVTPYSVDYATLITFFRTEQVITQVSYSADIERTQGKKARIEREMWKLKEYYKKLKKQKLLLESQESQLLAECEAIKKNHEETLEIIKALQSPLLPFATEAVAEHADTFNIPNESMGRWVKPEEYINNTINTAYPKGGMKELRRLRSEFDITWSTENPAIGRDIDGNILERTKSNTAPPGREENTYRYRYFLFRKKDLTIVTR